MGKSAHYSGLNDPRLKQMPPHIRKQVEDQLREQTKPTAEPKPMAAEVPFMAFKQCHDEYRSKMERKYADYLDALVSQSVILSWSYECVKLRVGKEYQGATGKFKTYWYTPDFMVRFHNGTVEFHEVKGTHKGTERGLAKFRSAQQIFDMFKFVLIDRHFFKENRL